MLVVIVLAGDIKSHTIENPQVAPSKYKWKEGYRCKLYNIICEVTIRNKIDFICLTILKTAEFSRKLHCLIGCIYSIVSAIV